MKFNVNKNVKVKLTELGIQELKRQHDELNNLIKKHGGKGLGEFDLHLDEDGYSEFQLWDLMFTFGHMMNFSFDIPFEKDIIIDSKDLQIVVE